LYAAGAGTAQAQTVTLSPVPTLTTGLIVHWKPAAANTATAPTLNVNALGAITITKCGTSALVANDILTTAIAYAEYDGTEWQLLDPQSGGCGMPTRDVIHASFVSAPMSNSQAFGYFIPDAEQTITVPASCTNSRAVAANSATASTVLTIYNCSTAFSAGCTSVGTITFGAGATTGTFTCSSSFSITGASGNGIYIQGPVTADTTLGNIAIALYGTHN